MAILPWAVLLETIIQISAAAITVWISTNTVFRKPLYSTNPTIIIYLWYQFIWSITTVCYCLFLLAYWRPDAIIHDTKTFYAVGLPSYVLIFLNTIIESFLGIDRIFTIIFPWKYQKNYKTIFGFSMLAFLLFYVAFLFYSYDFYAIFFDTLTMKCRYFGCILVIREYPDYAYALKLGAVIVTGVIGAILFTLTKTLLKSVNKNTKMHNTIIIIIGSSTILEFLPSAVSQIYNSMTNDTLSLTLGPYRTTLISVNISFCSWIYYKTLRKTFGKVDATRSNAIPSSVMPSSRAPTNAVTKISA